MKKPRILTLYEYSPGWFSEQISSSTSVRLNEVLDRLEKHVKGKVLDRELDKRNETIGVRAFQYVGVIHVDKTLSIEILPKMYRPTDTSVDERRTSIDNLFFMLDYCGQINLPHSTASQLNRTRGSFFETLIYLFASDLMDCIQNSAHHEYIEHEENLPYIKGKLLLSQHLKYNAINQSNFYLRSDEFTTDNQLNRVLKYVSKMLLAATNNHRNRVLLGQIVSIFDDVSDARITLQNAEKIQLTRLNIRFDQSLKLSKLFLSSQSLQLNASNYDSFTFLIDMNTLFEEFIATALSKAVNKYGDAEVHIKTQGPLKYFVERTQHDDRGISLMKPDISVLRHDTVVSIIDTKYKLLAEDRKLGVSEKDLYQMYAYAKKYKTDDITLLYPKKPGEDPAETDFYIDEGCTVKIRTFDLQRNLRLDRTRQFEKDIYSLALNQTLEIGA